MTAHASRLRTPEEIGRARERLQMSPAARRVMVTILALATRWAAIDDATLRGMVPPPEAPRAFNTSFEGCPIHGRELFVHGNYSWRFDPFAAPWKLVCPVGGEVYPSNDFAAFLAGGLRDRRLLSGPYADDGWGWAPPAGKHKHWFVAYYCHWFWKDHLIPAVLSLGRAYLLTAAPRYAHKAGVLLTQIARDYPRMDHNRQSRYAAEYVPSYTGKIVNAIWETATARDLAEAWDAVSLAVAEDAALGPESVDLVERCLLREALLAIPQRRILGNYGMHQETALYLALALGDPEQAAATARDVLSGWPGMDGFQYEGVLAVLANLFSAEGISYETAPGYCSIPSELLPKLVLPLERLSALAGANAKDPAPADQTARLTALVQWPPRLVCLERWTPAIGDSGGAAPSAIVDVSAAALRAVYRQTHEPDLAARLRARGTGDDGFQQFEDLFAEPLPTGAAEQATPAASASDVLTDYGLAILRAGAGTTATALSFHYGRANAGHAHADRLNVEFFGGGRKLVSDLGYPQFAAEDKTANAWDRNTGNHALVVVDGRRQTSQNGGELLLFASSPWLQAVAANAPAYAYHQVDRYERTALLIGEGVHNPAYVVDVFRVHGGSRHDYRLHGPDLSCRAEGITFGDELPGTLAGSDIPLGRLWDDPALEEPDRTRSFGSYEGSGDSFLYGIQQAQPALEPWQVCWGDGAGLAVHVVPSDYTQAFLAWGDVPRRPGNPARFRYLVLRREGAAPLSSTFATVLEPLVGGPVIRTVNRLDTGKEGQLALRITHSGGSDVVLATDPGVPLEVAGLMLAGRLAVVRFDAAGAVHAAYLCGQSLRVPGVALQAHGPLRGVISGMDRAGQQLEITLAGVVRVTDALPAQLAGTVVSIAGNHQQALVRSAVRIGERTVRLMLDRGAPVGQLAVDAVTGTTVTTRTTLYPAFRGRDDIGRYLEGAWLQADGITRRVRLARMRPPQGHTLELDAALDCSSGTTATLLAWDHGAEVRLEPAVWWSGVGPTPG